MGPMCHVGLTTAVWAGAKLTGSELSMNEIAAIYVGGVFIDSDKIFEIFQTKIMGGEWDITARCRILHSALAFPFGLALVWFANSWLPFLAILLHIIADIIPAVEENGRYYSSHAPLKFIMSPFFKKWWYQVVTIGWPVTVKGKLNNKLGEVVGVALLLFSCLILVL